MNVSQNPPGDGIPVDDLPLRISKKMLRIHFVVADGRTLRRNIFTDERLRELSIDIEYFDRPSTRNLTLEETRRIYEFFNIRKLRL